ncbi:MAG: TonB-dependent receptor [Bacteroidales bacterium]|nr:TonB-dependent receptor [Bacteroidales bacterium]
MQKVIYSLLLVVLLPFSTFSQSQKSVSTYTIKGAITDSQTNESVPFATVSVSKSAAPEVPFKRLASDANGKFEFDVNSSETLLLNVAAVGMKSAVVEVKNFPTTTIDLGKILLASNDKLLSEVTVTAQKPLVKVDLDKITYDMKADPESETANVLDMLRKVPMVTVDGEENIRVKGQSRFKIFMNGKETTMLATNPSQVLKSIPASSVKNIEVITEPGAKYEAEGLAGIINIITESAVKGYTGTVRANADNYGGFGGGLYFSTKIGKWGITTNLNQGFFKNPGSTYQETRESFHSDTFKYLYQNGDNNNHGNFRYGNLSISYEMDSLNLFTISGNGWGGNYNSNSSGYNWIQSAALDTVQAYRSKSQNSGMWGGYDGSLDYQRSFNKPDKLFTASYKISYSPNGSESGSNIENVKNYFDRQQRIKSNSGSTEHTFQLDYTEPFNKKHVTEAGVKYIYRNNHSRNEYLLRNTLNDQWESMQGAGAKKMLNQYGVLGAYGSYTYKLEKFSARAGARLEHTSGTLTFGKDSSFTQKPFTNLVPSITLSYKTSQASNMQLSYTQRISRPSIYYLNPFVNNTNPKNIHQGNPNLIPEISNSFNLNYNLFTPKFNFNGSVFTSFANNTIERVSRLMNDTIVFNTFENIGRMRNAGASTYFRWQVTKNFNWYANGSANYAYYSFTTGGKKIENKGFNYSAYLGASYSLPLDFRLNANGGYSSPSVSLQSKWYGYYYYYLSLNKAFLNKNLNISAYANGFLEKYVTFKTITTTDTYTSESIHKRLSPRFGLSVSYRFGEMKEQIKKVKRGIENDDVKAGGGGGGAQGQGGGRSSGN